VPIFFLKCHFSSLNRSIFESNLERFDVVVYFHLVLSSRMYVIRLFVSEIYYSPFFANFVFCTRCWRCIVKNRTPWVLISHCTVIRLQLSLEPYTFIIVKVPEPPAHLLFLFTLFKPLYIQYCK
jgi:hypothetical protein